MYNMHKGLIHIQGIEKKNLHLENKEVKEKKKRKKLLYNDNNINNT